MDRNAPIEPPLSVFARLSRGDFWLRVGSGIVMALLAVGAAWLGGVWFEIFWIGAGILIFWEWTKIVASSPHRPAWIACGAVYALIAGVAPIVLRQSTDFGLVAIVFLFAVVWMTDIGGYVVGRVVGGPKIWPAVSPKKTWSGAIGGMIAAAAAGSVVAVGSGLGLAHAWFLALLLSAVAQGGDFLESGIKRKFGVKDASNIIPGHGGVMDRLDGFIAAALLAALIGITRGGLVNPGRGLLVW